jgi:hypothetical protein
MFWHVLRFDMHESSPEAMQQLLELLRPLSGIPEVIELYVGVDVNDPVVVGMVMRLNSAADLPLYRAHPLHQEVVSVLRQLELRAVGFDLDES